jgi:hypothetical protein
VVHPDYDDRRFRSDLAVLRLATPTAIAPIAVPAETDNRFEKPGSRVRVTGWGNRVPIVGLKPSEMHEVEIQVVRDSDCQAGGLRSFDPSVEVCAGALLKDSCRQRRTSVRPRRRPAAADRDRQPRPLVRHPRAAGRIRRGERPEAAVVAAHHDGSVSTVETNSP